MKEWKKKRKEQERRREGLEADEVVNEDETDVRSSLFVFGNT